MSNETKPQGSKRKLPEGIRSKYEFVVAAAKEAERLNDQFRNRGGEEAGKVTMLALKRIEKGLSKVVYEDPETAAEDQQRKDTTFFFGS